jgi:short-subunit dehydrogenase
MGVLLSILASIGFVVLLRALFNWYHWLISYIGPAVDCRREFQTDWALVIGANAGLGRHLALRLAAQGLNVIGTGRDVPRLQAVKSECEAHGVSFIPVVADLYDPNTVSAIVSACEDRDIGVVLINAGNGISGPISDLEDGFIAQYMQLMATSYAMLMRAFFERNRNRAAKSVIYVTSSLAGTVVGPMSTLYFSSKAYVSRLAKHVAIETAGTNVQITAMHPGFFGDSLFFTKLPSHVEGFFKKLNFLITGSQTVANGVMRTIGKTDRAFVTPDSFLFPALMWMIGEWPQLYFTRRAAEFVKGMQPKPKTE